MLRNLLILITLTTSSLCFSQGFSTMKEALADQGLTEENIKSHELAIDISETVINKIGEDSNFGGVWYTQGIHGETILHIGQKKSIIKNSSLEKIVENIPKNSIEIAIEDVNHSIRELEEFNKNIYKIMTENPGILMSGINSERNKILIIINSESIANIKAELENHSIPESAYYIEETSENPEDLNNPIIRSGSPILGAVNATASLASSNICSAAFVGTWSWFEIIFTAGHCALNGRENFYSATGNVTQTSFPRGPFIGSILENSISNGADIAIFANSAWGHALIPQIESPINAPIRPAAFITGTGMAICKFGAISKWTCGSVQTFSTNVVGSSGYTYQNQSVGTFCAVGGDSGGPIVSAQNTAAVGILSTRIPVAVIGGGGSPQNCSNQNTYRTSFQPIRNYLAARTYLNLTSN